MKLTFRLGKKVEVRKEVKKIISRVKTTQAQLQAMLKDKNWVADARKFADQQGKELKKLFAADSKKIKNFIQREKKGWEAIQKQIPGEVQKLKKFVDSQKKELDKLLANVKGVTRGKKKKTKRKSPSSGTSKKKASSEAAS